MLVQVRQRPREIQVGTGVQVVCCAVSSPVPPPGDPGPPGEPAGTADPAADFVPGEGGEAAAEALRATFARLRPQNNDTWNFLANFTQMGDLYGPANSGASELAAELDTTPAPEGRRGVPGRRRKGAPEDPSAEVKEAMAKVVEAFRFLSARVQTLEERLARQDAPIEGAAWLIPARELGKWVPPLVDHLVAAAPAAEVLHADCGEGALLRALDRAGVVARGVEPRGGVALRALEQGCAVVIAEAVEDLRARPTGSLGGLVLSGVVDRLPLQATVLLVAEARRVLRPGARLVVVASRPERARADRDDVADDLLDARPLHARTWEVLLARAQFAEVGLLAGGPPDDGRVTIVATVPD